MAHNLKGKYKKHSTPGPLLLRLFELLYERYGPQKWWPADSSFEVAVGAILTQNTNWSNVEKSIDSLRKNGVLNPRALYNIGLKPLAKLIRPCGYYNIKARRLKNFIDILFLDYGGIIDRMKAIPLKVTRKRILEINGIGPETADSILLYALKKPVFVIDAYTRRVTGCLKITRSNNKYDDVQRIFMDNLPRSIKLFNEYHALIVEHCKAACKARPDCKNCVVNNLKRGIR